MHVSHQKFFAYRWSIGACGLALAVLWSTPPALGQDRTGAAEVRSDPNKPGPEVIKECRIKGDVSRSGDFIYYLPSHPSYKDIKLNRYIGGVMFCTEAAARAAGWKPAP